MAILRPLFTAAPVGVARARYYYGGETAVEGILEGIWLVMYGIPGGKSNWGGSYYQLYEKPMFRLPLTVKYNSIFAFLYG